MKNALMSVMAILLMFSIPLCAEAASRVVYVIPVEGDIGPGLAAFVSRALNDIQDRKDAAAVVLRIDTFGGRLDSATRMKDDIADADLPTIALVSGRAWSAGALIALACDKIVMQPGSSLGAAEPRYAQPGSQPAPVQEKELSAVRAEFRAAAEAAGRDPRIAEAMVDSSLAIEGLTARGKLLTLTAEQALKHGYAERVGMLPEALTALGYKDVRQQEYKLSTSDRLALFLTGPLVSGLLLVIGIIGLLVEAATPGWGVPGSVGIAAFAVFFGGHIAAGRTGWETAALFVAGIVLLALEVFVLPGFGVAGVTGLIALALSVILTFEQLYIGLLVLALAIIAAVIAAVFLLRRIPASRRMSRVILAESTNTDSGYVASSDYSSFIGKQGTALTDLRPAGVARIEGERLDVVTEGDYIDSGAEVAVLAVEGRRIIVKEVER